MIPRHPHSLLSIVNYQLNKMTVTKHYEHDHVRLYVEEDGKRNCITLESDAQIRRLAECLIDIDRTGARTAKCEPRK